jgi:hypothetical protein
MTETLSIDTFFRSIDLKAFDSIRYDAPDGGMLIQVNNAAAIPKFLSPSIQEQLLEADRIIADAFLSNTEKPVAAITRLTQPGCKETMVHVSAIGHNPDPGVVIFVSNSPMSEDYIFLCLYHKLVDQKGSLSSRDQYNKSSTQERREIMDRVYEGLSRITPTPP